MDGTHAQSLISSLPACLQNLEAFFEHAEMGEKGQNVVSSFTQDLISLIFAIHISFTIALTDGGDLVDRAFRKICDQSLFTCRSR